ncbi:MAG TPA: CapA family protein [Clostridiales bacterium]|mgnify:CR=1 FL=1|jgi:poly-gamma-glutamate synthesis protein (capsule biosynthesis protein)|nr:CapA family protein [Clostridiales bacterium]
MDKKTITLLAVGDNIPGMGEYNELYDHVAPLLNEADISFGQLETVLIDEKIEDLYPYVASQARMPCSSDPGVAPKLKEAGFDIISFASNHALDYGRTHFLNTIDYLRKAGLEVVGGGENEEDARRFFVIERNGTKIAFLSYCSILPQDYWAQEARPGVNPARGHTLYEQVEHDQPGTPCRIHTWAHKQDKANMVEDIKKARELADIVAVSMHWGIHFTQAEIAEYQVEYGREAIDAGADIVLGHHAHILKPIEVYKGKVIFYSLGNFAMTDPNRMERDKKTLRQDMRTSKKHQEMAKIRKGFGTGGAVKTFPEDCYYSMIAKIEIRDKKIERVSYLPVYIPDDFKPYVVKPQDPLFKTIHDYMIMINEMVGIETKYTVDGDEIVIG